MDADALWIESYKGEVLGEQLFGLLAERQVDDSRRGQLMMLATLERTTKELAEPVLERRGLAPIDVEETIAEGGVLADAVMDLTWEQFLGSFEPVISQFLEKYRRLVELAGDDDERAVAEAYVAHELALASYVRRSLSEESGEPLEEILALPHVAAAVTA
jgi:hypothetical protein